LVALRLDCIQIDNKKSKFGQAKHKMKSQQPKQPYLSTTRVVFCLSRMARIFNLRAFAHCLPLHCAFARVALNIAKTIDKHAQMNEY